MVRQSSSALVGREWSASTSKPSSVPPAPSTTSLCLPAILAWEVTFSSLHNRFVCCQMQIFFLTRCQMQLKPPMAGTVVRHYMFDEMRLTHDVSICQNMKCLVSKKLCFRSLSCCLSLKVDTCLT